MFCVCFVLFVCLGGLLFLLYFPLMSKIWFTERLRTVVFGQTPCEWPLCLFSLLRLQGRADDGQVGAGKPSESLLHFGNLNCAENTMEVISGVKSCGLFAGKIPFGNLSE